MAFDGIVVANLVHELKEQLLNGRIAKIAQPEADELLLTIKSPKGQRRLSISASASLPLIYLTDANKPSPMTAPNFCMLLRKHIANGRIVDIWQPKLERRSWANTAILFSVLQTERSLTASNMSPPR